MPAAAAPARDTQSEPWFHEQVHKLQEQIEQIEAAAQPPEKGASHQIRAK
jgi:hypothetical protein